MMAQSVKFLAHKQKNLSLSPRGHVKGQTYWYMLIIPAVAGWESEMGRFLTLARQSSLRGEVLAQ